MGSSFLLEQIGASLIEIALVQYLQVIVLLVIVVLLWQILKALKMTKALPSLPPAVSPDERDAGEFIDPESKQADAEKNQSFNWAMVVVLVVAAIIYLITQLTDIF